MYAIQKYENVKQAIRSMAQLGLPESFCIEFCFHEKGKPSNFTDYTKEEVRQFIDQGTFEKKIGPEVALYFYDEEAIERNFGINSIYLDEDTIEYVTEQLTPMVFEHIKHRARS